MPALAMAEATKDDKSEYLKSASKYLRLKLTDAYTSETKIFDYKGLMQRVRAGAGPR